MRLFAEDKKNDKAKIVNEDLENEIIKIVNTASSKRICLVIKSSLKIETRKAFMQTKNLSKILRLI